MTDMTIMELWVQWIAHPWVHWFEVFTGVRPYRFLHVWDVFWAPIMFCVALITFK